MTAVDGVEGQTLTFTVLWPAGPPLPASATLSYHGSEKTYSADLSLVGVEGAATP
jgi:hypothetical protein